MGSDIVYLKVPVYFAPDDDDELSKLGVDQEQELINGHEYILIKGAAPIISFNATDKEETTIRYSKGNDAFLKTVRMDIKEFAKLLQDSGITIIE